MSFQAMINKRRKQERARSAAHPRSYTLERVSFGEDAKQTLRNLSLINAHEERAQEWTKEEDNLSIASFGTGPHRSLSPPFERGEAKLQKARLNARSSTPVISNAAVGEAKRGQERRQLVPSSLNINSTLSEQRIHTGSSQHNFVGGKQLHLFKEMVFRKTAAALDRSFRPASLPRSFRPASLPRSRTHNQSSQKSLGNYLELSCRSGCSKIVPLHVHDLSKEVGDGKRWAGRRERIITSNKANIVRKLLKEQRNSNFNESIFHVEPISPSF